LALALDEPKETDDAYEIDGFTYLVDKAFIEKVTPIKIDFLVTGFRVTAGVDFGAACSSCDTARSCCS
jgi:Fe-S cluster assembly iron-binding protein IscA